MQDATLLDIDKDIRSFSEFKRNTPEFRQRIRESGHPFVLTINGRAELVVQDEAYYQKRLDRIKELEALEGVQRGLADVAASDVISLAEFEIELREAHALSGRALR